MPDSLNAIKSSTRPYYLFKVVEKRNTLLQFHFILCQKRTWSLQLLKRLFFCRCRFVMYGFCKSADKSYVFQYPHYGRSSETVLWLWSESGVCARLLCHVWLLATPWTVPARLLCPWNFPDKNTGEGCHSLLQGIFLTQGSNLSLLRLLHCRRILYPCATRFELDICNSGVELCCCKWCRILVC